MANSAERALHIQVGGIPMIISQDAIHAVIASHGPFADARRLSCLTGTLVRDLTRDAVTHVHAELGDATDLRFRLVVDRDLSRRLESIWEARPLQVVLLSRCLRQWQAWTDLLLAYAPDVRLCLNDKDLEETLAGQGADLILFEPLDPAREIPEFLMRNGDAVLGLLAPQVRDAQDSTHLIRVAPEGRVPLLNEEALGRLAVLVTLARGKALHGELASRRCKWILGARHSFINGSVFTTLTLEDEELIPDSVDLTAVVGWGAIPETRFADVLGHAAAKAEFQERYIPWLQDPKGSRGMHGVLLYGPPGTGKSMLAAAVAGEAGVSCIHVKGPELHGLYRGETEAWIRQTFGLLRKCPGGAGVMILDEIDALAPDRRKASHSEPGWYLGIVGEVLVSLDSLAKQATGRVLIVATTNHPDLVDAACIRSGRIGHHIGLGHPLKDERMDLVRHLLPAEWEDAALEEAAESSEGLSQADHARLAETVRSRIERGATGIPLLRLWQDATRGRSGRGDEPHRQIQGTTRWRMAVHVAGHLLAAAQVFGPQGIPPRVSLTAPLDDPAGGCLWNISPHAAGIGGDVAALLAVVMGGRAAEAWLFEDQPPGPGCPGDMAVATRLAHGHVSSGLLGRPDLPFCHLGALPEGAQSQFHGSMTKAVQDQILEGTGRAFALARNSAGKLLTLALRLDTEGVLSRREISEILEGPEFPY